MVFSKDDLAVIVACFTEKEWTGTRIAKEFPNLKWNLSTKEGMNHCLRALVTSSSRYGALEIVGLLLLFTNL